MSPRQIVTDETKAATARFRRIVEPTKYRILFDSEGFPYMPGRNGRIEWYDDHFLAVWTNKPRILPKLLTIPGLIRHEMGDKEARFLLPPEALEQVVGVIRARIKRPGPALTRDQALDLVSRRRSRPLSRPQAPRSESAEG